MTTPQITLPIVLRELSPEEVNWLASKSAQEGRSTDKIVHDLLSSAAAAAGFTPREPEPTELSKAA